jgi:CrcB protein
MYNFILVAIGGAIGAACRYGLGSIIKSSGALAGLGTFVVNAIGCLAIGLICGWLSHTCLGDNAKSAASLLLVTGVCGGFTTFSTYALDTVRYFQNGEMLAGLAYIFLSLFVGIALCSLGLYITTR